MNKALLLSGIVLFILGSSLVLGSQFVENKYSYSESKDLSSPSYGTWGFPNSPLELNEGDIVTVGVSMNRSRAAVFHIDTSAGEKVFEEYVTGNFTAYYYVKANDLYSCYLTLSHSEWASLHMNYKLEITKPAPNPLFPLIGAIVLLAGIVTIPVAFLYRRK